MDGKVPVLATENVGSKELAQLNILAAKGVLELTGSGASKEDSNRLVEHIDTVTPKCAQPFSGIVEPVARKFRTKGNDPGRTRPSGSNVTPDRAQEWSDGGGSKNAQLGVGEEKPSRCTPSTNVELLVHVENLTGGNSSMEAGSTIASDGPMLVRLHVITAASNLPEDLNDRADPARAASSAVMGVSGLAKPCGIDELVIQTKSGMSEEELERVIENAANCAPS